MKELIIINYGKSIPNLIVTTAAIASLSVLPSHALAQTEMLDKQIETNKIILVDQLSIGIVTVVGNKDFSTNTILNLLPALRTGKVLDVQKISEQVAFANGNPALHITVDIQPVNQTMANVVVKTTEGKSFRSMITYDNTGDDQTGRNRMGFLAIDYNWLGKAETAVLSYIKSPDNNKINQFGFMDSIPLPKMGDTLTISASYSNVDSGIVADYFNISGKGKSLGAHYHQNLKSSANSKRSIDYGIDYKEYNNVIDFAGTNLGTNVKTLPASISYQYSATGNDFHVSNNIGLTYNVSSASSGQDVFDVTRVGATVNYSVWRQNATYQRQLEKGWLFNARLESQYAATPLIPAEQFGLGGSHSVRGFNERAVTGDKGAFLTTEVYTPEIIKGQRLVVFVDQGKYWRNSPQIGELPSESIASYGVGWRLDTPGGTSVALDYGKVIRGTETTPKGSSKIHVSASQSF